MNEMRERVRRHTERNELPYRPRGEHHTRLEAFSDAVLAFAMTLSVLSLEIPHDSQELVHLFRSLPSFLLTFGVLFGVWTAMNRWCRRFGLEDTRTIWTFGAILFIVVFYTYPLKFLAAARLDSLFGAHTVEMRTEDSGAVLALYGVGYGVLCLLFWSLYRHAWSLRDVLELDEPERLDTQLQMRSWLGSSGFGVLLVALLPMPALRLVAKGPRIAIVLVVLAVMLGWTAVFFRNLARIQAEKKRFLAGWRAREAAAAASPGARSEASHG